MKCNRKAFVKTKNIKMINHGRHRYLVLVLISLIFTFTTAQSQQLLSLHPLFTEQTAMLMSGIENEWVSRNDNLSLTIQRQGDNFYRLTYDSAANGTQYEAGVVSLGVRTFLDLVPKIPESLGDNDYKSQLMAAHSLYEVSIVNDTLRLAALGYRYFYNQLAKNNSLLPHTSIAGGLLLLASTNEIRQFILEHIQDPDFFDDALFLTRKTKDGLNEKKSTALLLEEPVRRQFFQQCIPAFPHKDGWLGGDADVSVPINDTQSVYIFGDSYVGQKDYNRQSNDLKMVSSTVAIATCLPDGSTRINYYWRNMYSDHPEPVFRSFTNRYNLWPTNGFLYKNSLYVLMEKTGAKPGVSPDDFFPFTVVGLTLAKVVNPSLASPDKWDVDFIPISLFAFPMDNLHITLVTHDGYLYFFAENNDKGKLLRVNLAFIDSLQDHFEYYSLAHTWKQGVRPEDMEVVLSAQVGSTITYHEELKKWVMVCGPGFMNNKIGLRTATSLTGPWSDQTIVYECPEITPGTASYNKSNFCYFGRECFQNYDKKGRTMMITYDINTSDFSEINSNTKIYTPKVISVPLRKYGFR